MKSRKWIFAPAFLALTLGTATLSHHASAQPGAGQPGAGPGAGRGKGGKARRTPLITPMTLEKIIGKPLTDDQKAAVAEAAKAYTESLAKAVGLTTEELETKAKEFRKNQRAPKPAA